jgi:hypothetical protein
MTTNTSSRPTTTYLGAMYEFSLFFCWCHWQTVIRLQSIAARALSVSCWRENRGSSTFPCYVHLFIALLIGSLQARNNLTQKAQCEKAVRRQGHRDTCILPCRRTYFQAFIWWYICIFFQIRGSSAS